MAKVVSSLIPHQPSLIVFSLGSWVLYRPRPSVFGRYKTHDPLENTTRSGWYTGELKGLAQAKIIKNRWFYFGLLIWPYDDELRQRRMRQCSKHHTLGQRWSTARPTLLTLARQWINVGPKCSVIWGSLVIPFHCSALYGLRECPDKKLHLSSFHEQEKHYYGPLLCVSQYHSPKEKSSNCLLHK